MRNLIGLAGLVILAMSAGIALFNLKYGLCMGFGILGLGMFIDAVKK